MHTFAQNMLGLYLLSPHSMVWNPAAVPWQYRPGSTLELEVAL